MLGLRSLFHYLTGLVADGFVVNLLRPHLLHLALPLHLLLTLLMWHELRISIDLCILYTRIRLFLNGQYDTGIIARTITVVKLTCSSLFSWNVNCFVRQGFV